MGKKKRKRKKKRGKEGKGEKRRRKGKSKGKKKKRKRREKGRKENLSAYPDHCMALKIRSIQLITKDRMHFITITKFIWHIREAMREDICTQSAC